MGSCCCRHANAVADEFRESSSRLAACVGGMTPRDANGAENLFRVLSLDGLTPDGDAQSLHAIKKKPWDAIPEDTCLHGDSPKGASTSQVESAGRGMLSMGIQSDPSELDPAGPGAKANTTGVSTGLDPIEELRREGLQPPVRRSVKDFILQTLRLSRAEVGTSMVGTSTDTSMRKSGVGALGKRTVRGSQELSRLGKDADANNMEIRGRLGTGDGTGEGSLNSYSDGMAEDNELAEVTSSSAVKVAVMVRPLLEFEKAKDSSVKDIVMLVPPCKIKLPKKPSGSAEDGYHFDFDRVYRADTGMAGKQMFAQLVLPVVERFCQGFNGTVLAYGQTGSGKTYTMGTSANAEDITARDPKGVIPRAINVLFNYIELASKKYDLTLKATYYEIYNEQIFDLLTDDQSKTKDSKLDVREKPDGEVFIENVTEIVVENKEDVAAIIQQGNTNRVTAAHKMNSESSRSHAILGLVLEQRAKLDSVAQVPEDLQYLRSKLSLVDLAGSERQRDTGTTGDRFSEGVNINRGLLELGNVINALTEGAKRRRHVPYRNSKLTRVLQDSLGGNSETLFLACVSPADSNHDHTINTLRYASRARAIRNNLRLNNKLSLEEEVEYLRNLVLKLQLENARLKTENAEHQRMMQN